MTIPVIGIAATADSLNACAEFFHHMTVESGAACVVFADEVPAHPSADGSSLARATAMPVVLVEQPTPLKPDHVYLADRNAGLRIDGEMLTPDEAGQDGRDGRPLDRFFGSLADECGKRGIAVLLSGNGGDGRHGIAALKANGGLVLARSPETTRHDALPRHAIATGIVDAVLPVHEMAGVVVNYLAHPYLRGETIPHNADDLHHILLAIQSRTGDDFRGYKRTTLIRRIERRMGLRHLGAMSEYADLVEHDSGEVEALRHDVLIGVTGFFREPGVWDCLKREVSGSLATDVTADRPIRAWIPGCSTGEEVYTLAMLLYEACEEARKPFAVQLFATDLNERSLAFARAGLYPETIAADVSAERVQRFFTKEHHQYRISKMLRESVVFAAQNVISDAPFSNLDIISCRNLMIYLEPTVQQSILGLFHFGLREGGYLLLGNSETVGMSQEHFAVVAKEARLYRNRGRKQRDRAPLPVRRISPWKPSDGGMPLRRPPKSVVLADLMRGHLVKHFAPAAVLINANYEILRFSGPTERYLNLPKEEPVLDVVTLAKEGLRIKLRTTLHRVVKGHETVQAVQATVKRDIRAVPVRMTIHPLEGADLPEEFFVVTFQDDAAGDSNGTPGLDSLDTALSHEAADTLVQQLESELLDTREDLQHTIEALEASNEELRASNEEMMSMNEELQTSNEELETSKEELQSLNEELHTVNTELQENVKQVEAANNDLQNLMNSTDIATLFLDTRYALRRFTPAAQRLFTLGHADIGCPLEKFEYRLGRDHVADDARKVIETLMPVTREVLIGEEHWYIRRMLPFRTHDHRIDGLVLTFTDITHRKQAEQELRESEHRFRLLANNVPVLINATNEHGAFMFWNTECEVATGYSAKEVVGNPEALELFYPATEYLRRIKAEWAQRGNSFRDWEIRLTTKDGDERVIAWSSIAGRMPIPGWSSWAVGVDVTDRKRAEERLAQSEAFLHTIYDQTDVGFLVVDVQEDGCVYAGINATHAEWLGISPDWIIGKTPGDLEPYLGPETVNRLSAMYAACLEQRRVAHQECCLTLRGTDMCWAITVRPLFTDNPVFPEEQRIFRLICTTRDITDRKNAEAGMQAALHEKDTLLRELYHRTKNNMQVVLSMLNLQASRSQDPDIHRIMREIGHKIQAMALVHQKLYQARDLSHVRLDEYIRELTALLMDSYAIAPDRVRVHVDSQDIAVFLDTAIPCGLVLNELISNTLKYAFPDDRRGEIRIGLSRSADNMLEMRFADNGVGLPAEFDLDTHANLGLQTLALIVRHQLHGTLEFTTDTGVDYRIRFADSHDDVKI